MGRKEVPMRTTTKRSLKIVSLALLAAINIFGIALLARDDRGRAAEATGDSAEHEKAVKDVMRLRMMRVQEATYIATHVVLEEDDPGRGDVFVRRGPVLILGREGDAMLGLTTQCTASILCPNYSFLDPSESAGPEIVHGAIRLEDRHQSRSFGAYPVANEMNWNYSGDDWGWTQQSKSTFLRELYPSRYWTGDHRVLWNCTRSVPSITVEPLGDNDLAFVRIPVIDGIELSSLQLDRPRDAVNGLLGELQKLGGLFGRNFTVECEECVALRKRVRLTEDPLFLKIARIAPIAGALLGYREAARVVAALVEIAWEMAQGAERLQRVVQSCRELEALAWAETGLRVELIPADTTVVRGDLITHRGMSLRLAHIRSSDEKGADTLRQLLSEAWQNGLHVDAVVERHDYAGVAIVHLIVRESVRYLNLTIVRRGAAEAYRHPETLATADLYDLLKLSERPR